MTFLVLYTIHTRDGRVRLLFDRLADRNPASLGKSKLPVSRSESIYMQGVVEHQWIATIFAPQA